MKKREPILVKDILCLMTPWIRKAVIKSGVKQAIHFLPAIRDNNWIKEEILAGKRIAMITSGAIDYSPGPALIFQQGTSFAVLADVVSVEHKESGQVRKDDYDGNQTNYAVELCSQYFESLAVEDKGRFPKVIYPKRSEGEKRYVTIIKWQNLRVICPKNQPARQAELLPELTLAMGF